MSSALRVEIETLIPNMHMQSNIDDIKNDLGIDIDHIERVAFYKIQSDYLTQDNLLKALKEKGSDVFVDPLIHKMHLGKEAYKFSLDKVSCILEISPRAGVTDNTAYSIKTGLKITDIDANVASGQLYFLFGDITKSQAIELGTDVIANDLIEKIDVYSVDEFKNLRRFENVELPEVVLNEPLDVKRIELDSEHKALSKINIEHCLALSVDEMDHIRSHYADETTWNRRESLDLPPQQPTDVELEIIAQTWSEHCAHKIFSANINYVEDIKDDKYLKLGNQDIKSLYKTYIKGATSKIEKDRKLDWLISVFSDNAGIVRFDPNIDLCIKAETHNTPSALDPYGGALTGILGVNRDILGVGLGARPIANTDVFCFAPPNLPYEIDTGLMPANLKGPKRILDGVHAGVEDGGNKSGIPTVNGAFFFDVDYAGKPLVFCGTVGVLPPELEDGRKTFDKIPDIGDRIVMAGGAIGADGIHGATFSSMELTENSPVTAVQIGDPLTQKRLTGFLLEARDAGLYSSLTDNGAGGLSSSVGEMAIMTNGAKIDLALCPVKYSGLKPYELMVSESQERMTFAVPPQHMNALQKLADKHAVEMTDIGVFDDSGDLAVYYGDDIVGLLDLDFLHNSLPKMNLTATWSGPVGRQNWKQDGVSKDDRAELPSAIDNIFLKDTLLKLLASPNIASKEKWVRRYDHEVQAATHIKPFNGKHSDGPSDSGVIWLAPHGGEQDAAISIGCGIAPRMSLHDPYMMAQYAVDEAIRNVVVSGGDIDTCCLLDNFCWPDPVLSDRTPDGDYKLGQLVRSCKGLYDICLTYGIPLVSGKDSMKNDYRGRDKNGADIMISVLPTLLVTAMAKANINHTVSSAFKNSGDFIYILGLQTQGLAGSELAQFYQVPDVMPEMSLSKNLDSYRIYYQACQKGLLQSGHDISDGGLMVAIAESMIGGRLGAEISLDRPEDLAFLDTIFNETMGRFVVSVSADNQVKFAQHFKEIECQLLGQVTDGDSLKMQDKNKNEIMNVNLDEMVKTWKNAL